MGKNQTLRVTITDRAAWDSAWGSRDGWRPVLRTVDIPATCPKCGGPRGEPRLTRQCEDGEWFSVHQWRNPCGHIDKYRDVLAAIAQPHSESNQ